MFQTEGRDRSILSTYEPYHVFYKLFLWIKQKFERAQLIRIIKGEEFDSITGVWRCPLHYEIERPQCSHNMRRVAQFLDTNILSAP